MGWDIDGWMDGWSNHPARVQLDTQHGGKDGKRRMRMRAAIAVAAHWCCMQPLHRCIGKCSESMYDLLPVNDLELAQDILLLLLELSVLLCELCLEVCDALC